MVLCKFGGCKLYIIPTLFVSFLKEWVSERNGFCRLGTLNVLCDMGASNILVTWRGSSYIGGGNTSF